MKIEVTEEMRGMLEARSRYNNELRAEKRTPREREAAQEGFRRTSQTLAFLVAEAVEKTAAVEGAGREGT